MRYGLRESPHERKQKNIDVGNIDVGNTKTVKRMIKSKKDNV